MRIAASSLLIVSVLAGCATTQDEPASSTENLSASTLAFTCKADNATVTFHNENGKLAKAVYSETTNGSTRVVAEMGVCHEIMQTSPVTPDRLVHTDSCNDVLFIDGYKVDVFHGGFTGLPQIKLAKVNGANPGPVEKSFACQFNFEEPGVPDCRGDKIRFSQAKGCENDGAIELCVPVNDDALRTRIRAINPDVAFMQSRGRAGCNLTTQRLAVIPTKANRDCVGTSDAMTNAAWANVCKLSQEPAIREILPSFFE